MKTTIDLAMITNKNLVKTNRRGRAETTIYVVKIPPFVKYFKTSMGAHKYLLSKGFRMEDDNVTYTLKYQSDEEIFLMKNYKIY